MTIHAVNRIRLMAALVLMLSVLPAAQAGAQTATPERPDVIYVPTPMAVVDAMLQLAKVTSADVVYDLGCGDGRIPVTAAKKFGARGVCIDIDPERIREADENIARSGVGDKVRTVQGDLFQQPLGDATVVTVYLLDSINERLLPKLRRELKPGTRIVSHAFRMGTWAPEQTLTVDGRRIFFWTIPPR
jgi:cyclopropane fatty-acyl-phospholipid synthase-like methyltransferase